MGEGGALFHPEVFARWDIMVCSKLRRCHVVWACEVQIPRGAHRIQEGESAPLRRPPLNETLGREIVGLREVRGDGKGGKRRGVSEEEGIGGRGER